MSNTLQANKAFRLTDISRLWDLIRQRGLKQAWVTARATLYYRLCAFEGRRFDAKYGVETAILGSQTSADANKNSMGFEYVATSPTVTRAALKSLPLGNKAYTFVDVGCGKGRALIVAAESGQFKRVIGIDIAPDLVAQAAKNMDISKSKLAFQTAVDVECCDATKYAFPNDALVLHYFAAPRYDNGVLLAVIDDVRKSRDTSGKAAYLVVVNNHEDLSAKSAHLERVRVSTSPLHWLYAHLFSLGIYRFTTGWAHERST